MTKLSLETKKLKLTLMKFLSFYNNFFYYYQVSLEAI